jgi:serine/threonine protein kinase
MIRDYRILKLLGEGGMGKVYLAEDNLERMVAIKELLPELTRSGEFLDRFRQEAKIQARLNHPNIVSIYSFFEESRIYYIVMEYVEGMSLRDLIRKKTGPIEEKRACRIFRQVLEGVEYAHNKGVVHRDLKPGNILIDQRDDVKIMDFGIAKMVGDIGHTRTGATLGTLYYESPEQINSAKDVDSRTDIFSLGITLFEMLTGKLPYNTDTDSTFVVMKQIVEDPLPDPRKFYPHISDWLIKLLAMMTEKDRNVRIKSCRECINAIESRVYPAANSVVMTQEDAIYEFKQSKHQKNQHVKIKEVVNSIGMKMALIPAGTFNMGSPESELGRFKNEKLHKVTLTKAFYIGKYPVTLREWKAVMGSNSGYFKGEDLPIEQVSWFDAVNFCNKLSSKDGLTPAYKIKGEEVTWNQNANGYRLPTEAEWEYSCRAGSTTAFYNGAITNNEKDPNCDKIAWYKYNSGSTTHAVGSKTPNAWGLYDMSGNEWEWCWDWYDEYQGAETDPVGPASGSIRVLRGGSWYLNAQYCRSADRLHSYPGLRFNDIGFRLVFVP